MNHISLTLHANYVFHTSLSCEGIVGITSQTFSLFVSKSLSVYQRFLFYLYASFHIPTSRCDE